MRASGFPRNCVCYISYVQSPQWLPGFSPPILGRSPSQPPCDTFPYQQNQKLDYPVLYLLDGQRNFGHTIGTLDLLNQSNMAQEMIVVAIMNTHRTRDFTPTYDESYNQWGFSGGADKFLNFIEQELMPYIDKHYRTNDSN